MVKAGHTSTVEVLKFLRAFEDETDYNVWSSISNILSRLSQLLGNTPYREGYDNVRQDSFIRNTGTHYISQFLVSETVAEQSVQSVGVEQSRERNSSGHVAQKSDIGAHGAAE